ncbi:polysaccharide deacetylase family protein [bacterium]|nr:polysaccharide deacetylase family protein [bacterium]
MNSLFFRLSLLSLILGTWMVFGAIFGFWIGWKSTQQEILVILTFHGVTETPAKPWEIEFGKLKKYVQDLKRFGFEPLSPSQFEPWMKGLISGGRRFMVTFDDGLLSSAEAIKKLKAEEDLDSVFFIVTDFLGMPGYIDVKILQDLSKMGCWVGLHGKDHQSPVEILAKGNDLKIQLLEAQNYLQQILGKPVKWYAYPFGEFDEKVVQCIASAGITYGFSIAAERVTRTNNPLLIPRLMFLKNAEKEGEPVIEDYLPPAGLRNGILILMLAFFVLLWGLRNLHRFYFSWKNLAN